MVLRGTNCDPYQNQYTASKGSQCKWLTKNHPGKSWHDDECKTHEWVGPLQWSVTQNSNPE